MDNIRTNTLSIPTLLHNAWRLQKTCKRPIWMINIVFVAFFILIDFGITQFFIQYSPDPLYMVVISQSIAWLISGPFYAGTLKVCLICVRQQPIDDMKGFHYITPFIQLALTLTLINLLASLGGLGLYALESLLNIQMDTIVMALCSFIYSYVIISFLAITPLIIINHRISTINAILTSYKWMKKEQSWIILMGILLIISVCTCLIALPILIGLSVNNPFVVLLGCILLLTALIWIMPCTYLIMAQFYNHLAD